MTLSEQLCPCLTRGPGAPAEAEGRSPQTEHVTSVNLLPQQPWEYLSWWWPVSIFHGESAARQPFVPATSEQPSLGIKSAYTGWSSPHCTPSASFSRAHRDQTTPGNHVSLSGHLTETHKDAVTEIIPCSAPELLTTAIMMTPPSSSQSCFAPAHTQSPLL